MATKLQPFTPERLFAALQDLPETPRWWVAFSGGADSTALLHAMSQLRGRLRPDLRAVHIDHGLHRESEQWRSQCELFCQSRAIPIHTERVSVPGATGAGLEAEARRQRYAAAERLLGPGETLLTAHHADDQAETLLLNLMRGSGPDGLAGMPRVRPLGRGLLARPLLDFSGASLRSYLQEAGISWIEDSSNLDESRDRNFVRARLIPMLERRWPGARNNLATSARYCREASEFVGLAAHRILERCLPVEPVLTLSCLPGEDRHAHGGGLTRLLVRHWLRLNQAPPLPARRLEELLRQVAGDGEDRQVAVHWDGWVIYHHRGSLWLHQETRIQTCPDVHWDTRKPLDLGPVLGTLRLQGEGDLTAPLRVRSRQPGDRLECLPGGRTRAIKDLLREAGVPPWLRASVPLLEEHGKIVAAAGCAIARPFGKRLLDQRMSLRWLPADETLRWVMGLATAGKVDRAV